MANPPTVIEALQKAITDRFFHEIGFGSLGLFGGRPPPLGLLVAGEFSIESLNYSIEIYF